MNNETLGRSTKEEREGLTAAVEGAEVRRGSLVQPGRCSGQQRGGSEARRPWRHSGAEASRGGRRSEGTEGKKEMTRGPIYKVRGVTGARIKGPEYWISNRSGRLECRRLIN